MTEQEMLNKILRLFLERSQIVSHVEIFTDDGVVIADPNKWASFTLMNEGISDIDLYNGLKTLTNTDPALNFGAYFNFAKRADRIPFKFTGGGAKKLVVTYDQFMQTK